MNNQQQVRAVAKFGGGNLWTRNGLTTMQAYERASELAKNNNYKLSVVSAAGGVTDMIINAVKRAQNKKRTYKELFEKILVLHDGIAISDKTTSMHNELYKVLNNTYENADKTNQNMALAQSFGERISAELFSIISGFDVIEPNYIGIYSTTNSYLEARLEIRQGVRLDNRQYVMGGYYAQDIDGKIRLTGRGGSDYSCAVACIATDSNLLELWKNVDGVMTADPRVVENAVVREEVGFHEAAVLAHYGMKIIHPRAPDAVRGKGISFNIRNFYNENVEGTRVVENKTRNGFTIAYKENVAMVDVADLTMANQPGHAGRVFSAMSDSNISVDIISTSQSSITFTTSLDDGQNAYERLSELGLARVTYDDDVSLMTIVADTVDFIGLTARTATALTNAGISNIHAISKGSNIGELNLVMPRDELNYAMQYVHDSLLN